MWNCGNGNQQVSWDNLAVIRYRRNIKLPLSIGVGEHLHPTPSFSVINRRYAVIIAPYNDYSSSNVIDESDERAIIVAAIIACLNYYLPVISLLCTLKTNRRRSSFRILVNFFIVILFNYLFIFFFSFFLLLCFLTFNISAVCVCVCVIEGRSRDALRYLFSFFAFSFSCCGALRLVEADRILLERLNVVTVVVWLFFQLRRAVCRLWWCMRMRCLSLNCNGHWCSLRLSR